MEELFQGVLFQRQARNGLEAREEKWFILFNWFCF